MEVKVPKDHYKRAPKVIPHTQLFTSELFESFDLFTNLSIEGALSEMYST